MFTLMDDPRVSWPVKVMWPADGGTFTEETFTARFRILPDDERKRITQEAPDDYFVVLRVAVVGWGDILDDEKLPVPFSAEKLDRMLKLPPVAAGLTHAYGEILSGKAAEGN